MINPMQNSTSQNIYDWIAASLRWLVLLGIAIALAMNAPLSLPLVAVLIAAAFWNVSLTLLAVLSRRLARHQIISVAGDMLIAYSLFYLSGSISGNLPWAGLLPLISASLFFQLRGALIVTVFNLVIQALLSTLYVSLPTVLVYTGILMIIYLALTVLFNMVVGRVIRLLSNDRRGELTAVQQSEEMQLERRRAIYKLISGLSATLNYQRVLETALDLSADALSLPGAPADRLVSAVLLFSENEKLPTEMHVGSARRFTPSDLRINIPGTGGVIGHSIDEGVARLTRDPGNDPELGRILAVRACNAALSIPLRSGLDTCGILLFAHPDADFFTPERREVLDIVGNQVSIAIENARLYQDLESEKERMMEIQEEGRKKMARDLHDGPTQSVSAIAMRVNFARRLMERDPKATAEELFKIEDLARRTTKEIRHMLFTLRPLVLESQGLIPALESMAEKMHETYGQNVIIQADADLVSELEMGKQAVIFYIAEEAVNNARKHAKADHIWIRLKPVKSDLALLEVEDDGLGFDTGAVDATYDNRGSLGMVNMRERSELVNGVIHIDSIEGKGTRIQVVIPLNEEASDRIRRGI